MEENDIMVVRTGIMKGALGTLISNLFKKKTGRKIDVSIYSLEAKNDGNEVRVNANVELTMSVTEFMALISQSQA